MEKESIEERLGLGSLSDEELLVASGEIEALLAERREERERLERERREQEEANRRALEEAAKARVGEWVEYEWTRCGNPTHTPCRGGAYPHGPYWYHYFTREDGTYTSRYVGKHLDADAARVLEAHLGKRAAKKALMRGDYRVVEVEAETLTGFTPEEVYPEQFEEPHREKVLAKAAKKRAVASAS